MLVSWVSERVSEGTSTDIVVMQMQIVTDRTFIPSGSQTPLVIGQQPWLWKNKKKPKKEME